jgi:glycerol kinase
MSPEQVLVIDAGTTGIRSLVIDRRSQALGSAYTEFPQYHPGPDRVEQDPEEIWEATRTVVAGALADAGRSAGDIAGVGITNQRATTVVWDRGTGAAVAPAIVWQDTRTSALAAELMPTWGERVYARTGWTLAPVYSSLSLRWLLDSDPALRERAEAGTLAFGTVDSWLIHKLTGGAVHAISASNASVTGAYDLLADGWYEEWLAELGIPLSMLPEVRDDSGDFGTTDAGVFGAEVPIAGAVADQQSALFAQHCFAPGEVKSTHGTGTFLDMNVGAEPVISTSGLSSLIAWRIGGETTYALEGYAAVTGAAVQWLRDGAELVGSADETEGLARAVPDNGGVYFVPALVGLQAPWWDASARGTICGIDPSTTRAHLVRAALEGIVYSVRDFLETMATDAGHPIATIRADGGASRNDFLLQFQADALGVEVVRPANIEATALGAAYLAGLAVGLWADREECFAGIDADRTFTPAMGAEERDHLYEGWKRAVERARGWLPG